MNAELYIGSLNLSPYISKTGKYERLTDVVFLPKLPVSIKKGLVLWIGHERNTLPIIYYSNFPIHENRAYTTPHGCNTGWYPHKDLTQERLVFAFFGASHFLCLIFKEQL